MLNILMVEPFCLRKKVLKIGLWHKLRPMCVLFLVLVWGGGCLKNNLVIGAYRKNIID